MLFRSWYGKGVNAATVAYSVRIFSRHWKPGSCLEMGPAEGLATAELVKHFKDLTCVDGAETFCAALRARHAGIKAHCALFEEYEPERRFDNIVLGHVLEHVADPVVILARAKAQGELGPDKDPRTLARFLTTMMQGTIVMIKAGASADTVKQTAETAFSILD